MKYRMMLTRKEGSTLAITRRVQLRFFLVVKHEEPRIL